MLPESAGEEAPEIDPFADLLFALIATVLPAILVLLPVLHLATPRRSAPASAGVAVGGREAATIVAEAAGLRLVSADNRQIALSAVPVDPGLRESLMSLRATETPLLILIEPAGLEAAFLLEPIAASYGPVRIMQLRAATRCVEARDPALAQACALPVRTFVR